MNKVHKTSKNLPEIGDIIFYQDKRQSHDPSKKHYWLVTNIEYDNNKEGQIRYSFFKLKVMNLLSVEESIIKNWLKETYLYEIHIIKMDK